MPSRKLLTIVIGLPILIMAGLAINAILVDRQREKQKENEQRANAEVAQFYLDLPVKGEINDPYISGKIIALDPQLKTLHTRVQDGIPPYLRPTSEQMKARDQSIGTAAWIECEEKQIGVYLPSGSQLSNPDIGNAKRIDCEVTIVDLKKQLIVGRRIIEGTEPPGKLAGARSNLPQFPIVPIVRYLMGLPRKSAP